MFRIRVLFWSYCYYHRIHHTGIHDKIYLADYSSSCQSCQSKFLNLSEVNSPLWKTPLNGKYVDEHKFQNRGHKNVQILSTKSTLLSRKKINITLHSLSKWENSVFFSYNRTPFSEQIAKKKYRSYSENQIYFVEPEAISRRCSVKKVFLKTSQNPQKNTCIGIYF